MVVFGLALLVMFILLFRAIRSGDEDGYEVADERPGLVQRLYDAFGRGGGGPD